METSTLLGILLLVGVFLLLILVCMIFCYRYLATNILNLKILGEKVLRKCFVLALL